MIPAILVKDKVVVGDNHGDAFSKLSDTEKNDAPISGFIDCDHDKFVTETEIVYLKDIILLRHAQAQPEQENGPITEMGERQARKIAIFLQGMCLSGYSGFCSPYKRCLQTAIIIKEICSIEFDPDNHLSKQQPKETTEVFQKRIVESLDNLPKKSVLITHTDFIKSVLLYTHLIGDELKSIANCSITYIHQNRIIWLAKDLNAEENRS
jgi:broad specificity phosphatase PhoE